MKYAFCRHCQARIAFVLLCGVRVPVDAEPDDAGSVILTDREGHRGLELSPELRAQPAKAPRYRRHVQTCGALKGFMA